MIWLQYLEFCVSSQVIQFCGLKRMQIEKFFAEHSFLPLFKLWIVVVNWIRFVGTVSRGQKTLPNMGRLTMDSNIVIIRMLFYQTVTLLKQSAILAFPLSCFCLKLLNLASLTSSVKFKIITNLLCYVHWIKLSRVFIYLCHPPVKLKILDF